MKHITSVVLRSLLAATLAFSISGCDKLAHKSQADKPKSPLLAQGKVKRVGQRNIILEDLETDTYLFVDIIDQDKAVLSKVKAGDKVKVYGTEVVKKTDGGKSVSSDIEAIELPDGTFFKMTE